MAKKQNNQQNHDYDAIQKYAILRNNHLKQINDYKWYLGENNIHAAYETLRVIKETENTLENLTKAHSLPFVPRFNPEKVNPNTLQ